MRNTLAIFTAVCVSSVLFGCQSSKSNGGGSVTPPTDEIHVPSEWNLTLQAKCPENSPTTGCLGAYGFSVFSDGHYQVGPGPKNEVKSGPLSTDELKALEATLNSTPTVGTVEGHRPMAASGGDEVITMSRGSQGPEILMRKAGTDLSFFTTTGEVAIAIHSQLRKLAEKYYSLPFPDECADAAAPLTELLNSVQACSSDEDCSYVSDLEAVEAESGSYITTDDCSVIRPLAVANASTLESNKPKILEGLERLRQICGDRFQRTDCRERRGFQLEGLAPVCQQGVCRPATSTQTTGSTSAETSEPSTGPAGSTPTGSVPSGITPSGTTQSGMYPDTIPVNALPDLRAH